MREVTFCERSTLTEAWVELRGRSVPIVPEEPAALVVAVRRQLPDLKREPAMVFAEVPHSGPVAPFWNQQWSWETGRLRARVGHRYLSVHRLADDEHVYESHTRSLEPAVAPWLDACAHVFDDSLIAAAVAEISYGYINTFRFPEADFDLSRSFRLTLGIELEGLGEGLEGLDLKFHYRALNQAGAQIMLQISARPEPGGEVVVQTKTTATRASHHWLWRATPQLENEIRTVKNIAKRAFFELATEETHQLMGAHYEDSD
jgi:hypothetical protein